LSEEGQTKSLKVDHHPSRFGSRSFRIASTTWCKAYVPTLSIKKDFAISLGPRWETLISKPAPIADM
jgi:hypothetical protein